MTRTITPMWVLGLLLSAVAVAAPSWQEEMALRDSLREMGPLLGHRWLEKNGQRDFLLSQSWKPSQDSGLVCVGRWSYGPSLKVSLRVTADDTVICLTRGSGASLVRFRSQDSVTLDLLGDVNFAGTPRRAIIQDTLVIAGIHSGGTGLEVHGISNPGSPNLLSRIDLPVVNDIAVNDSLVYAACEDDSLRIYSIADPRNPRRVGACRDSCDLFMTQAGDYCYLVHVSGVNIVDVSDPTNPHRAGRIGGGEPLAVFVRDTFCYETVDQFGLKVYSVSNVGSPRQLGSLSRPNALDLTMAPTNDTVVYTSLLDIISVADPSQPKLVGHADIPVDREYGVAVLPTLKRAFVANYFDGVVGVVIANPANPVADTTAFAGGSALDIAVENNIAYVGSYFSGLSILDVGDPSRPRRLGLLDYVGRLPSCLSVAAQDTFAFVAWDSVPQLRSVDVSNPRRPSQAGGCDVFNRPEDMFLRDSLLYCAMPNRFQVVNVARPRQPVLVGSCVLPGYSGKMVMRDSIAYVTNTLFSLVSVADPRSPLVLGNYGARIQGVSVVDTVLYGAAPYTGLLALSVTNPTAPYALDSLWLTDTIWWSDVVVVGTVAYVGGERVWAVDVSDPRDLRLISGTSWTPPYLIERMEYREPYIYAVCLEAGVCVLETVSTGVAGPAPCGARSQTFDVWPTVAAGLVLVRTDNVAGPVRLTLFDAAGQRMKVVRSKRAVGSTTTSLPMADLLPGVYVVRAEWAGFAGSQKVVKLPGR